MKARNMTVVFSVGAAIAIGSLAGMGRQPTNKETGKDADQPASKPHTLIESRARSADELGIRTRSAEFVAAWNKHDASTLATFFSPDADMVNPFGRVAHGREAIESRLRQEHETFAKTCTMQAQVAGVRPFGEDLALVDWEGTMTGMASADNQTSPTKMRVALVMRKVQGGPWMFEAARPYIVAPEPMEAAPGTPRSPAGDDKK